MVVDHWSWQQRGRCPCPRATRTKARSTSAPAQAQTGPQAASRSGPPDLARSDRPATRSGHVGWRVPAAPGLAAAGPARTALSQRPSLGRPGCCWVLVQVPGGDSRGRVRPFITYDCCAAAPNSGSAAEFCIVFGTGGKL